MACATNTSASLCWARAGEEASATRQAAIRTRETSREATRVSAGAGIGSVSIRGRPESPDSPSRQRPEMPDQLADLLVGQVEAERGHPGLAQGGAPVLDEGVEILVAERVHGARVGEIAGPHEENGRPPGPVAAGAVTGGAVGKVEPLGRGGGA